MDVKKGLETERAYDALLEVEEKLSDVGDKVVSLISLEQQLRKEKAELSRQLDEKSKTIRELQARVGDTQQAVRALYVWTDGRITFGRVFTEPAGQYDKPDPIFGTQRPARRVAHDVLVGGWHDRRHFYFTALVGPHAVYVEQ